LKIVAPPLAQRSAAPYLPPPTYHDTSIVF
jgi:hypothetical protein